jgi:hypothetical protein
MTFSHSIKTPRLAAALISSALAMLAFTATASADFTPCQSGTTTWVAAGSGNWDITGNWSNGQPSGSCNTVIAQPVTVTLSTTTQHFGNDDGVGVNGVALSNGATLAIQGESSDVQGDWLNFTQLVIGPAGLTIGKGSTLDLEASDSTQTPAQGAPGGNALVIMQTGSSVPFVNAGTINATSTDSKYSDDLRFGANLANAGAINATSGTLNFVGTSPMLVNNTGSVNVASGASVAMNAGDGSAFTNAPGGTFANQGNTTLTSSMHWIQRGGTETGNPVQMTGGEVLEDSAGTGAFETIDGCGGGSVTGTIPQGQTITVQGATQNCSGNLGQTSQMGLGSTAAPTVVNHGTIVLSASGTGNTTGGSAQIDGGTLDNFGTLDATITDRNYTTMVLSPLVNEKGATVNLTGGKLYQSSGTATTNRGTVNIGPGGFWQVQGGSFTNSGKLVMKIAGKKSYGVFNLIAGGAFKAGGTLAPTVSGFKPATGTELPLFTLNGGPFTGTFKSVSNGFRGDYSKETKAPATVDVIYGAAKQANVTKVSGGPGKITVKLACAKGKPCAKDSITVTDGKSKVASGSATVKAGKSATATVKLNAAGKKLIKKRTKVKVVVKAAGKTLKTATVAVTK